MQLNAVGIRPIADLQHVVLDVRPIAIYHAVKGRNAWWSTWITRYAEGSLHTSSDSACESCEYQRTQGTKFYVKQLAAIALTTKTCTLIVTEINTKDILGQLDFEKLTDLSILIPFSTMTAQQLIHIFDPNSSFWPSSFRRRDSIIMAICNKETNLDALPASEILSIRVSRSAGTGNRLRWAEVPSDIKYVTLLSLANILQERLTAS